MKRSTLLLSGLLLLILGGLFFSKYLLKLEYAAIDKSDLFGGFNRVDDLDFSHVFITGGNKGHVHIETGNENKLLIDKQKMESFTYSVKSDTLFIVFDPAYTFESAEMENYWGNREMAVLIIQGKTIKSLTATNASIGMDKNSADIFTGKLNGNTNLEITTVSNTSKEIDIESHGVTKLRLNRAGQPANIAQLKLELFDESQTEIYQVSADSSAVHLHSNSRLSVDSSFF